MDCFDYILSQLQTYVIRVRRRAGSLPLEPRIEFLDAQFRMEAGVLYLADCADLRTLPCTTLWENGSFLLVGNCTAETPCTIPSWMNGVTLVECHCSPARLYNLLSRTLERTVRTAQQSPTQTALLQEFWDKIRNHCLVNHGEVEQALRGLHPDIRKYYRLVLLRKDRDKPHPDHALLESLLHAQFPAACLFTGADKDACETILLQFFDEQPFSRFEQQELLEALLTQFGMHAMVSNCTRDYGKMDTLYMLVSRADYLAQRLKIEKNTTIFFYEQYSAYSMMDLCSRRFQEIFGHNDILYLIHPVIVHLMRYDQKHNTNLREVLYYYLLNNQDLKHTADLLYMHRNTVANKINLIRSICPVDFGDGALSQRLLLSCQIVMYNERILSNQQERENIF